MGCLLISPPGQDPLDAGVFSEWLGSTRKALQQDLETDVPCGDCTACCRSSWFIHIKPEETGTLDHIPKELLFPAPGLPDGNVLMGFDEQGRCPMLRENGCSIYTHRPLTCRSFDCRVLPASGITVSGKDKLALSDQIRRWRFSEPTAEDAHLLKAVRKAASFIQSHASRFPADSLPSQPVQRSLLALKVYELFLGEGPADDETSMIQNILNAAKAFDSSSGE